MCGGGETTTSDHCDGQTSETSPDYPCNKVALNGTEQGIAGGQFNPHGAVHFISSQVRQYFKVSCTATYCCGINTFMYHNLISISIHTSVQIQIWNIHTCFLLT